MDKIPGLKYNRTGVMNGIVLLNKPEEMTSFSAAAKCRRILGEKKAGHTGTLDPNATGLMIILLGHSTKLLPYCTADHKRYTAEFCMGLISDTEDIWGDVQPGRTPRFHDEEELQKNVRAFTGDLMQVPPMYSAKKINGRKLYELARKGMEVERKAVPIKVEELSVEHIEDDLYCMQATVSSGTYIRTLITDFCNALGEDAVMTKLTRTGIGPFDLAEAYTFEDLENGRYSLAEPVRVIDPKYPLIETDDPQAVKNGRPVFLDSKQDIVLLTYKGEVLAAYERREENRFHCLRGLY